MIKELAMFSGFGNESPEGHPDSQKYIRAEGLAKFVRSLTINPDATREAAPELWKLYNSRVDTEAKKSDEKLL